VAGAIVGTDGAEPVARRMHGLVDGLSIQVLGGHLSPADMVAHLDAYLDELFTPSRGRAGRSG
jgi:selenophosphate synthetase-related protein